MASNRKKTMVTMIAAAMAAAMVIGGGSFAYLQSQSNTVTNKFNTNIVEVSAGETDLKDDNTKDYDIIPGKSDPKDPFVTIKNTVPAYLFVTINDTTDGLVQYEVDTENWKALPGYEGVYYKVVEGSRDQDGNPVETKHYVLKDNKVDYSAALENKDMVNADGTLKDGYALSFVGFGIQQEPFYVAPQETTNTETGEVTSPTDAEIAAAVEAGALKAYRQNPDQVPTLIYNENELKEKINNAAEGETVSVALGDDIQVTSPIAVSGSIKIDGNGHAFTHDAKDITRFFNVTDNKEKVTLDLKNLSLDGTNLHNNYPRCITIHNNTAEVTINLDNVNMKAGHYPLNVGSGNTKVTINAKDTTIQGYAALNIWSPTEATFDNCTLIGYNAFGKNNTNNFATIAVYDTADNTKITMNHSVLDAQEVPAYPEGNYEAHVQNNASNLELVFNDVTVTRNGDELDKDAYVYTNDEKWSTAVWLWDGEDVREKITGV